MFGIKEVLLQGQRGWMGRLAVVWTLKVGRRLLAMSRPKQSPLKGWDPAVFQLQTRL